MKLVLREHTLDLLQKTCIMGILNVTPDSFWDGGKYSTVERAVARAHELVAGGADVIDIGGESTRPGSAPIEADEEIRRIGPVVEALVKDLAAPISIDTRRSEVAREMLALGAHMVNDVSGLVFDEGMVGVVREFGVPVVIMHMRGLPQHMQNLTEYDDVVARVRDDLLARVRFAEDRGVRPENIVIDPGIGFAKTAEQNLELIARLAEIAALGKPILVGPSMKSFIGKTVGLEPNDRAEATIACCIIAAANGAHMVRVHEVAGVSKALAMADRIRKAGRTEAQRIAG
jgi:dihydropteroate synthase